MEQGFQDYVDLARFYVDDGEAFSTCKSCPRGSIFERIVAKHDLIQTVKVDMGFMTVPWQGLMAMSMSYRRASTSHR